MLLNKATLSAMFTGFKTIFNNAFSTAESQFEKVAMVVPSSTSKETYAWLGQTTHFREWLGDRVIQNLGTHDYSIKNRSFENTVGVNRDDIEDDAIGIYSPLVASLGQDARTHPDELIFALMAAGFASLCYDGQNFIDSDHPVLDENGDPQSVSNYQSGATTPWFLLDTTKPIKPFIFQRRKDYQFVAMDKADDEAVFSQKLFRYGVDARVNAGYGLWQLAYGSKATLDETNYAAARAAMMSMKGDNGKPLNIRPSLLVVPPALEATAKKLLIADTMANGATNIYKQSADVLVCPWLV